MGVSASNCSDGALIAGARPLDPEAVTVDAAAVDRARLLADLKGAMQRFEPGEILRDRSFPELIRHTVDLYREINEMLDGFDREKADFGGVYTTIKDYLVDVGERIGHVDSMMIGTLTALPRIGMFYGYRVEEGELRRRVFDIFMTEMRKVLGEMEQQTIELFARLDVGATSAQVSAPAA
jgi:hypothetical protein